MGLTIDKSLTWKCHIDDITKKVSSGIGALKRMRDFISEETAIQVYKSLVEPYFSTMTTKTGVNAHLLMFPRMGNLHYRLNFDPGKTNKIFRHSSREPVKISKIAKFGSEIL